MQLVLRRFDGLSLLWKVNADRIFTVGTVVLGLLAGAFLGTALVQPF